MDPDNQERPGLFAWAKSIALLLFAIVISYKIIVTPFNFQFDFNALLSLLLALFSVGLAALFYFKATETSNTFYDNTYKFTKDIAELLTRIESGFGERLRHLDEGYASMVSRLDSAPAGAVAAKKQEIKKEEEEVKKKMQERDELIKNLVERAQLKEGERNEVVEQLRQKDEELLSARRELDFLRQRLSRAEFDVERIRAEPTERIIEYIKGPLRDKLSLSSDEVAHPVIVDRRLQKIVDELPSSFLRDLKIFGLFDGRRLTPKGYRLIRDSFAE
jgi:hypothetical protein